MMNELSGDIIKSIYQPRKSDAHKGDHGHALIIAGAKMRMGAAVIAAEACLRAGAGLTTINVPSSERGILQTAVPEAMLQSRKEQVDLSAFSCVGIGPAIGTGKESKKIIAEIFKTIKVALLLDADAITILSGDKKLFAQIPAGTILTPHPKEFDRLFGVHESEDARRAAAVQQAKEKNIIIVLKGHQTLITNRTESFLNTTGNAGLAKGGSGDALTGIITALLAQKYFPFDAARLGVYLHGLAADLTLSSQSLESMQITDVIQQIGNAFKTISG